MNKKILILTWSYGSGHMTAANELSATYMAQGDFPVVVDLAEYYRRSIGVSTKKFYEVSSSDFPKIWEFTYDMLDNMKIKELLYGFKYPYFQKKFNKLIEREIPDVVIIVFPFWNLFLKNYLKEYTVSFTTALFITDAITIHSVWYMGWVWVDYYFFIDDASREIFRKKFHHPEDNLVTTFFPLQKKYFLDRSEIKVHHILIILSNLRTDFTRDILTLLKHTNKKVTILQWRNAPLYKKMKDEFRDNERFIFSKFINLKEYFPEIDICISKPWWATVSECIATDTPLIIPDYVLGQEEWNKKLIEDNHLGVYENNPEKIIFLLDYLHWSKMLPSFHSIKNPHVCEDIVRYLS